MLVSASEGLVLCRIIVLIRCDLLTLYGLMGLGHQMFSAEILAWSVRSHKNLVLYLWIASKSKCIWYIVKTEMEIKLKLKTEMEIKLKQNTSTFQENHCMATCLKMNSLRPSDAIWWHRSVSTLAQVMACCPTAPSHYLNQCWLIISKV